MSGAYSQIALLEACAKPGCPLCRVTQRSVYRFLEGLFYEKVNDWGVRKQLRKSRGFCNAHSWVILESSIGNSLGVAIIYHDVLTEVLRHLTSAPISEKQRGWLSGHWGRTRLHLARIIEAAVQALTPQVRCPACEELATATHLYLSEMITSGEKEGFAAAFSKSDGLCLPHLLQALTYIDEEGTFNWLLEFNQNKLEAIHSQLAEFVRKSDHRFIKDGFGEEGDAWRRILAMTAGAHPLKSMD